MRTIPLAHHSGHQDKPGERQCTPFAVPEALLYVIEHMPRRLLVKLCGEQGHPSFWLGLGYRYYCLCGKMTYHD